mgnify:CR=1 FL=1
MVRSLLLFFLLSATAALAQQIKDAEEDVADAKDDEARRKASENLEHLKALQGAI